MVYFGLFILEIVTLCLLSRAMSRVLSGLMPINLLSFLLLPGVIIHELSHLLIAVILFVPVGNMEFTPKLAHGGVKLGSVEIAKTDPVRRAIIGFAPVFVGLMIVIGIVYLFTSNILFFEDKNAYIFASVLLGVMYLLFAISNTMFSSKADMEGTLEIIVTLLIIAILLYILGLRVPLSLAWEFLESNSELVKKSSLFLSAPIVIDVVMLGVIKVFYKGR